jgi:hypothetical protein
MGVTMLQGVHLRHECSKRFEKYFFGERFVLCV